MHPALFPFSQPKTSHQSSKLHPDPDCAVLCRYPMWHPFPSLFRNNWSCHRHGCRSTLPHPRQHLLVRNSDTATTSTLLDSRCWISFTEPLQPFPPRTLPKLGGRNPGFSNKTTVCRSLMLVVIPGDAGLFEVPQAGDDEDDEDDEDPSVNGVVGKKRPSGVLCRFVGFDCRVMPVCGALFVCLLGGLGLLRDGWVASKREPSACNGDGLGSFEREAEDCFPVSPLLPGFPSSYCDVCCLKCHKLAMMKTMKTMKVHQSLVLWGKNVHRAFSAVSFARVMLICWKGVAFCVMKYRRFYQMMNKWAFAQQKWEIVFSFHFFALFPAFSVACCVIGFVFSKMDPRNLWGWNFDQCNRTKRMMATKREFDHKIVFSLVVSSCYTNRERDLK